MDDNIDPNLSIRTPGNNQTARTNSSDDEVVICSPRGFNEARKKPRRSDTVLEVTDDENDSQRDGSGRPPFDDSRWLRRGRSKFYYTSSDEDGRINSEDTEKAKEKSPPSVPVPKEPEFICPVCMEPIVEETTTKCGHIFCKECITKALAAQKKCPTCRRKLRKNDIYRIYFPPT